MKHGDKYRHFKGAEYTFHGLALPIEEDNPEEETVRKVKFESNVKHHDSTHSIELYFLDGVLFIDSDVPHVIYVSKDNTVWAREVDDFFGCKVTEDGTWLKRFTKLAKK